MEIETKMRTFELINSNEWQLIKELLRVYSNNLIVKGIQLTAEEAMIGREHYTYLLLNTLKILSIKLKGRHRRKSKTVKSRK